jgi:hypothetical protein
MIKRESDSKGPCEFIWFALELPEELFVVSMVIALVFSFVWLLGGAFRSFFGE